MEQINQEAEAQMILGGMLGIGQKYTDFILGADLLTELVTEPLIDRQIEIEYNQGAEYETRNYCTIFSAFTMLSYLKNKKFNVEDIKCVGNKMILDGKLNPDSGAYLSDAIDYVRKWYNARNEDKVASYAVDISDDKLLSIIDEKNLAMQIGYKTSTDIYLDSQDNGVISGTIFPKLGGHAVTRWGKVWWIVDNYFGLKKFNRYSVEHPKELIDNGIIFKTGYIYL